MEGSLLPALSGRPPRGRGTGGRALQAAQELGSPGWRAPALSQPSAPGRLPLADTLPLRQGLFCVLVTRVPLLGSAGVQGYLRGPPWLGTHALRDLFLEADMVYGQKRLCLTGIFLWGGMVVAAFSPLVFREHQLAARWFLMGS